MPRNRLSLSVRVGRKVYFVALLGALFEFLDNILLTLHVDVLRRKIMLLVNAHFGLGEVADMTHRSNNLIPRPEIFLYCFRLCRRLYYY